MNRFIAAGIFAISAIIPVSGCFGMQQRKYDADTEFLAVAIKDQSDTLVRMYKIYAEAAESAADEEDAKTLKILAEKVLSAIEANAQASKKLLEKIREENKE
jgi:hypothetical protein